MDMDVAHLCLSSLCCGLRRGMGRSIRGWDINLGAHAQRGLL